MIKDILQSIKDVEIYPIISLIVFFLLFIGIVVWLIRMDKEKVNRMRNLPLNNDNNQNLISGEINEKNN